ncbi:MAG: T9SS type A sorting domain-containing protein [bacterium]|nr:T9SS type A sorting domain-containing protein [bacterium]
MNRIKLIGYVTLALLIQVIAVGSAMAAGDYTTFLLNQGQVDTDIAYYAAGLGGTVFLTTDGELVYSLPAGSGMVALRETFIAAAPLAPGGGTPAQGTFNSFRGEDTRLWRRDIPAWRTLRCGEIYPGVELELHTGSGSVEKVFAVSPGADVASIRLKLEGMSSLALADDGALIVATELGELTFSSPVAWQEGERGREAVEVAYVLAGGSYGFSVGDYDHNTTLMIDPLLASTLIGGGAEEQGLCGALDAEGNVYTAGFTTSVDFPASPGVVQGATGGNKDIFIARFTADLTERLSSTYLGGSSDEEARGLAVDAQGRVYVTGNTMSNDFPVRPGAYKSTHDGNTANTPYRAGGDIFIGRLTPDLDELQVSTYLGGAEPDWCRDLAIDADGDVIVAGFSQSSDYPCVDGYDHVFHASGTATMNGVISKLDGDLTTLKNSTYLGGTNNDYIESLALNGAGDVFLTGWIASTDFPTTPSAYQTTHGGTGWMFDAFVTKLDNDLGLLLASTFLGGFSWDFAYAVAVDAAGDAYVTGHTASYSSTFPVSPSAWDTTYSGVGGANVGDDVFVTKFEGEGLTEVLASTYLGDRNWENGWALAIDQEAGSIYVGGSTNTPEFPMSPVTTAWDDIWGGGTRYSGDGFVSKLDLDLTTLQASTFIGDSEDETVEYLLAVDGGVYAMGFTESSSFPYHPHGWETGYAGGGDAYVVYLDSDLSADLTAVPQGGGAPGGARILGNWPNPFNPHTTISFSLEAPARVQVKVYASDGSLVTVLVADTFQAGHHDLTWDGRDAQGHDVSSGTYLVRLDTGASADSRKLVLLR